MYNRNLLASVPLAVATSGVAMSPRPAVDAGTGGATAVATALPSDVTRTSELRSGPRPRG